MNINRDILQEYVFGDIIEYKESFINIPIKDSSGNDGSDSDILISSEKKLIGVYIISKVLWYGLHFLYKDQNEDRYIRIKICEKYRLKEIRALLNQMNNKSISHGDIIVCPRPILNYNLDVYTHWAIYDEKQGLVLEYVHIGEEGNVIGSSGINLFNKCILKETKINEFLERENWIHTFTGLDDIDEKPLDPDQVIVIARNLIKNNEINKNYNLFTRNCQHYASYCKFGKAVSMDVVAKTGRLIEYIAPIKIFKEAIIDLITSNNNPFHSLECSNEIESNQIK